MNNHSQAAVLCKKIYSNSIYEKLGLQMSIYSIKDSQYVVIRGSDEKIDWLRNLWVRPNKDDVLGYAHSGFSYGAKSILPYIMSNIDKDAAKNIIVTGHSLGAGVALCLSIYLAHNGYSVSEYVGFGAPRTVVNSSNKLKKYNIKPTHYCYGNDIVSKILPLGILYTHPNKAVKLGKASYFFPNWKDHSIDNYVEALN